MASKLLGRTVCPICDDATAHVKIKTDKEAGKEAFPYIHCRECDIQVHTRKQSQAAHLLRKTRPEKTDTTAPESAPAEQPGAPVHQPAPVAPAKTGGMLSGWTL